MGDDRMRIGEFAVATGISIDAIRFYERRGVLRPAPRTSGGYRTFDQRDVDRVRMARHLQMLGMKVEEVVEALMAHDLDGATCASERWRLERVKARLEHRLAELQRTRRLVRDALASCEAGRCELASATDARGGFGPGEPRPSRGTRATLPPPRQAE